MTSDGGVPVALWERARAACPEEGMAEDKWMAVCIAITEAAHSQLGRVKGRQPDWFQESLDEFRLKLRNRNEAFTKWLATSKREDLVQFKEDRSVARKAIRQTKNTWFQAKADEAQRQHFGGKFCGSAFMICRGLAEV